MAQRILRPLDYGGLFDELFDLYKKHFVVFAGISAFVYIPFYTVIFGIFMAAMVNMTGLMAPSGNSMGPEAQAALIKFAVAVCVLVVLSMLAYFPAQAATTWAVSKCYLGESVTIAESFKAISRRLFMFALTVTITVLIIYIGLFFCIIPGVIFGFWFAFVTPVYLLEGKSLGKALARSRQLAEGNWGRIFVVYLIAGILSQIISRVLLTPFQISWQPGTMDNIAPSFGYFYGMMAGVAMAISAPITVIALTLLYYDIRIRKEGFDIEMLASNMSASSAQNANIEENKQL